MSELLGDVGATHDAVKELRQSTEAIGSDLVKAGNEVGINIRSTADKAISDLVTATQSEKLAAVELARASKEAHAEIAKATSIASEAAVQLLRAQFYKAAIKTLSEVKDSAIDSSPDTLKLRAKIGLSFVAAVSVGALCSALLFLAYFNKPSNSKAEAIGQAVVKSLPSMDKVTRSAVIKIIEKVEK